MNIIILNGPPGVGKSTVGEFIEQSRNIKFFSIDQFYNTTPRYDMSVEWHKDEAYKEESYRRFKEAIITELEEGHDVVIEGTGTGRRWRTLTEELHKFPEAKITTFLLKTTQEIASGRVDYRHSQGHHFTISETEFKFLSDRVSAEVVSDFEIDSSETVKQTTEAIFEKLTNTDIPRENKLIQE